MSYESPTTRSADRFRKWPFAQQNDGTKGHAVPCALQGSDLLAQDEEDDEEEADDEDFDDDDEGDDVNDDDEEEDEDAIG